MAPLIFPRRQAPGGTAPVAPDERLARIFPSIASRSGDAFDPRVNLIEQLRRRVPPRSTFMDDLRDFAADIRANPALACVCIGLGMVSGLVIVVVPALLIAGVVS
jgi:hypothetical protein